MDQQKHWWSGAKLHHSDRITSLWHREFDSKWPRYAMSRATSAVNSNSYNSNIKWIESSLRPSSVSAFSCIDDYIAEPRNTSPQIARGLLPQTMHTMTAQIAWSTVDVMSRHTALTLLHRTDKPCSRATDGSRDWNLSRREYLAVVLAVSGTGATAGGAASGVIGEGDTDIEQAVIIRDIEAYASGGGVSIVDRSNTNFTASVDVRQGEQYVLHLLVDNRANNRANQQLRINEIPDPLSIEVFGDKPTGVDVQSVDHTEWVVNIEPEHPTDSTSVPDDEQIIEVLVDVANSAAPGTYELSGALEPASL